MQVNPERILNASKSIYTHMPGNRFTISRYHSQVNLILFIPSRLWHALHISMSSIGICVLMSVFTIVVCVGL